MPATKFKIAENITKYRQAKGMTVAELAEKIGVSESMMNRYENAKTSGVDVAMVSNLAVALDVAPDQLTGWGTEALKTAEKNAETERFVRKLGKLNVGHKKAVLSLMNALIDEEKVTK